MKKIVQLLMLFIMLFITIIPIDVLAQTVNGLEEEVAGLDLKYQKKVDKLNKEKADLNSTTQQLKQIDLDKQKTQAEISQTNIKIEKTLSEITTLEKELPIKKERANEILIATQQSRHTNFLVSILFGGDSASEAIRAINGLNKLNLASSKELIALINLQEKLKNEKINLQNNRNNLILKQHQLDLNEQYIKELIKKLNSEKEKDEDASVNAKVEYESKKKALEILKKAGCKGDEVYGVDCGTLDAGSGFIKPINSGVVTNEFGGWATSGTTFHTGIDLANDSGTPIYPSSNGQVLDNSYNSINGNYLTMLHVVDGKNYVTYYGHMISPSVYHTGKQLGINQPLGYIGMTGAATGYHVHFSIASNTTYWSPSLNVNPRKYVNFPPKGVWFHSR